MATVAVLFTALAGCAPPPAEPGPVVRPVKVLEVADPTAATEREYPGTVKATRSAAMAFEVSGRIIEFPVEEGQRTKAGTLLARIDPRDYEARLVSARAELRKAKADYERARNLQREDAGAIAQTSVDAYQTAVEVAEAVYSEAEKAVEETILRAPFDGVVARRLVEEFENVQAKEPVVVVQDPSGFEMVINVPERDFAGRQPSERTREEATEAMQPRVVITSVPDNPFPARLKEIATAADPTTRTYAVTLAFDVPDSFIVLPGMTARAIVRVAADGDGAVRIPAHAAVREEGKRPFVWLVDPASMRVSRRTVELGELSGNEAVVHSGLSPGELIATSGLQHLREDMQVSRFRQ